MVALHRLLIGMILAVGLFGFASAPAPEPRRGDDVMMRLHGPVHVGANDAPAAAMVINGDAIVDGSVRDRLLVVNGTATVRGRVQGETTVINGRLILEDGASVNNVSLVNSQMERAPAAVVTGAISSRQPPWSMFTGPAAAALFWVSITLAILLAGVLFALLGRRSLMRSARVLTARPGATMLTALAVWLGVPVLAIGAMMTMVGIPFGLALLFAVLPGLWVFGYIVAATRLGAGFVETLANDRARIRVDRPVAAVIVGIITLQVIGIVPFAGALIIIAAGFLGAGALVLNAARPQVERVAAQPPRRAVEPLGA